MIMADQNWLIASQPGNEATKRKVLRQHVRTLSNWNILAQFVGLIVTLYIPWSSVVTSFIFSHHLGYRIEKVHIDRAAIS